MRVLYFRSRAIQLMLLVAATLIDTTVPMNQNPLEAYRSAECFAAMKHEMDVIRMFGSIPLVLKGRMSMALGIKYGSHVNSK